MAGVRDGLRRLERAAANGDIAAACEEFSVDLLVVFGSAISGTEEPNDLDLAAHFIQYDPSLVVPFIDRIADVAGTGLVDLMVLNRAGPVARERALLRPVVLHEARTGIWANAQIAAIMERMDTAPLRREALELMAR